MKKLFFCLICIAAFAMMTSWGFAEPPVSLQLSLDKEYYTFGEPIFATVTASNPGSTTKLINEGFTNTVFIEKIRIIDPAGRQMGVIIREIPPEETPDAPPLPVILRDGKPVHVIGWEELPPGWQKVSGSKNLQGSYPLELPGNYSAQVLISVMSFKPEDPGNIRNYEYQGVVKSNPVYFYMEGTTEIQVNPPEWELKWLDPKFDKEKVEVKIHLKERLTPDDYNLQSFKLNNQLAFDVKPSKNLIKVHFHGYDVINSLGDNVKVGEKYPAVLSGTYSNNVFFGGSRMIKVVK